MSGRRTRLSALIVNYRSGAYAIACVESLQHVWALEGRDPADLEIVVVDNDSPVDQTRELARLEELGAVVDRADENLGYARGMNRAYSHTSGGPDDAVAILNPDLFFLPGSVAALLDCLASDPRVGLVDPRQTISEDGELVLPRNAMPTLYEHALAALAHRYRTFARIYTRRRLRHDVGWVLSDRPIDTDMISGCCLFMRRGTVDALGGEPMDAAFPLYYEDTDLCRRVKRLGLRVMHAGNAPVVHHWSRSAGAGAIFEGEPRRRYRISQDLYFRRYYGAPGAAFARWCNRRSESWAGREESSLHDFVQLGECSGPPTFEWGGRRKYLIEASYIPNFMLAGAIVGEGESYTMSSGTWDWMFPGRVFVRLLDPEDLSFVKAWTFTKTTEPRDVPLALHEVFGADARVAPEVSR